MNVLITGSEGQLGCELKKILKNHNLFLGTKDNLDITKYTIVERVFKKFRPGAVVHAAAYTKVDDCEKNSNLAFIINRDGTKNIARVAKEVDAKMVYISTDYVFDGKKRKPYTEEDVPHPQSIYAKSKLDGEKEIRKTLKKYFILRSAWLYSKYGQNFSKTILSKAKGKKELKVVDDQVGSPTYAKDLAFIISKIVATEKYGIYHAVNSGYCSWYEFTKEIIKMANLKTKVVPIKTSEILRPVPRPAYSVLDNSKIQKTFGLTIRSWKQTLKEFIGELK